MSSKLAVAVVSAFIGSLDLRSEALPRSVDPDSIACETSATEVRYHQVIWGENLFRISRKYSRDIHDIAELNKIEDINSIKAGQIIQIPEESPFRCSVDGLNINFNSAKERHDFFDRLFHQQSFLQVSAHSEFLNWLVDPVNFDRLLTKFAQDEIEYPDRFSAEEFSLLKRWPEKQRRILFTCNSDLQITALETYETILLLANENDCEISAEAVTKLLNVFSTGNSLQRIILNDAFTNEQWRTRFIKSLEKVNDFEFPAYNPVLVEFLKGLLNCETVGYLAEKDYHKDHKAVKISDFVTTLKSAIDLEILSPATFKPQQLVELVRNRENPKVDAEKLIWLIARSDWNGAFTFQSQKIYAAAKSAGVQILMYEVAEKSQLQQITEELNCNGAKGRYIVFSMHGRQKNMQLGERLENCEGFLTSGDVNHLLSIGFSNILEFQGEILLASCSTGSGGKSAENMANAIRTVFPQAKIKGIVSMSVDDAIRNIRINSQSRRDKLQEIIDFILRKEVPANLKVDFYYGPNYRAGTNKDSRENIEDCA